MLKSIIIDDERLSRELLQSLLKESCPNVDLIGEADNAEDAVQIIDENQPDLVFLDIEMPQGNGFEVLKSVKDQSFMTVFVTAYNDYAIRAIKEGGFDYLLKPVDVEELKRTISRAVQRRRQEKSQLPLNPEELNGILLVPHTKGFKMVSLRNIVRLEADNNYTTLHLADSSRILISKSIAEMESKLVKSEWFFRTHRSHIINFYHFIEYLREDGGYAVMRDGKPVSLSRTRHEEFLSRVKRFANSI